MAATIAATHGTTRLVISTPQRSAIGLWGRTTIPSATPTRKPRIGQPSALVAGDVLDRVFHRVGGYEQFAPRGAIHVAPDRHAHVIKDGRREIDDAAGLKIPA